MFVALPFLFCCFALPAPALWLFGVVLVALVVVGVVVLMLFFVVCAVIISLLSCFLLQYNLNFLYLYLFFCFVCLYMSLRYC